LESIKYKKGYKYQLDVEYSLDIKLIQPNNIETRYIYLNPKGLLIIKAGYSWDGPSGPTVDSKSFMRGSLVHDALYQLMRHDKLNRGRYRKVADQILRQHCREDGMSAIRAWYVYQALRKFGKKAASKSSRKKVLVAP